MLLQNYNYSKIKNEALDSVQYNDGANRYFDISNISPSDIVDEFTIEKLYSKNVNDTNYILHSLQGFDVDNDNNVFISSQKAPIIDPSTGRFPMWQFKIIIIFCKKRLIPN